MLDTAYSAWSSRSPLPSWGEGLGVRASLSPPPQSSPIEGEETPRHLLRQTPLPQWEGLGEGVPLTPSSILPHQGGRNLSEPRGERPDSPPSMGGVRGRVSLSPPPQSSSIKGEEAHWLPSPSWGEGLGVTASLSPPPQSSPIEGEETPRHLLRQTPLPRWEGLGEGVPLGVNLGVPPTIRRCGPVPPSDNPRAAHG
jgi:hypothetical protein